MNNVQSVNRSREWAHWLVLAIVIAIASALRLYRISDSVDGYHAYNEAWYAIIARNYADGSLLTPRIYGIGIDFRTPPLYSYLVYLAQLAVGDFVVAGRIVSTLSSAVAITFTFLLGRLAFGSQAGSFAAVLFGFAPVAVAVGRNAQTDMTYLAFLLGALYFYLQSRRAQGTRDAILTGVFFAGAFFTKYFAALLPFAILFWEVGRERNREQAQSQDQLRKLGVSFGVFAVLIAPYYLYHLSTSFDAFWAQQIGGAVGSTQLSFSFNRLGGVLEEEFFGFSPLAATLIAGSTVFAVVRRDRFSTLYLFCFLIYFVLFYLNNHHSYYMLTQLPFLALLAGGLLHRIRPAGLAAGIGAVLLLSGSISSLLFLSSVKYGWDVPKKMVARMTEHSPNPVILLEQSLMASTGPVLKYYCPGCDLVVKERLEANSERIDLDYGREIILIKDDLRRPLHGYDLVRQSRLCPTAFGKALVDVRRNRHAHSGPRQRQIIDTEAAFGFRPCGSSVVKAIRRLPRNTVLFTRNGVLREKKT